MFTGLGLLMALMASLASFTIEGDPQDDSDTEMDHHDDDGHDRGGDDLVHDGRHGHGDRDDGPGRSDDRGHGRDDHPGRGHDDHGNGHGYGHDHHDDDHSSL